MINKTNVVHYKLFLTEIFIQCEKVDGISMFNSRIIIVSMILACNDTPPFITTKFSRITLGKKMGG